MSRQHVVKDHRNAKSTNLHWIRRPVLHLKTKNQSIVVEQPFPRNFERAVGRQCRSKIRRCEDWSCGWKRIHRLSCGAGRIILPCAGASRTCAKSQVTESV